MDSSQQAKTGIWQGSEQHLVKLLNRAGECIIFMIYSFICKWVREKPSQNYDQLLLHQPQQSVNLYPISFVWEQENGLFAPAKFSKRHLLNIQWHVVAKKFVMVDGSVDIFFSKLNINTFIMDVILKIKIN